MTAEAGPDYAGFTVQQAREQGRRRARGAGPHPPPRALHPHRPVQPPLGRAHRAAHLAAVVHGDGRAGRAGDRGRRGRADPDPARVAVAPLPRVAAATSARGASRASCGGATRSRSGTARTRRPTSASSRRTAPAGSAIPTCSTPGSPRRCGRSRRSAGRSETDELRAFYPTDVLSTARDILFLWVARMVMMGLEFTGDVPFTDVYVHSVIQAPDGRRMSKSLGTGIDPLDEIDAHGADAVRFGLLAMSSTQDVRYSSEKVAPGPGAGQQAVQRRALRAAATSSPRPSPTARPDDDPGPLDPQPPAGGQGAVRRERRRLRLRQGLARPLRLRLRRAVRLVPRVQQGPRVRRRPVGDDAPRPARDAAARAPGDPVRDRGAVVARPRRRGPARHPAGHRARRRRCATPMPRRASGAVIAAVTALRSWRDEAGVQARPGAPRAPGRPRRRRRARGADGAPGPRGGDGEPTAAVPFAGGTVEIRAGALVDPAEEERKRAAERERAAAARSRAPSPSWPTRASWPRRPSTLVAAEREKLDRLRRELEARCDPRRGRALPARASSCSACASAWTGCAG